MQQGFFVHKTAVIDEGAVIGEGSSIWHFSHLMKGCVIGSHCTIGQNVFIASTVVLGNHVKVQNNVSLYDGVVCEDDVFFGPSCVCTNVINPRSAVSRKNEFRSTRIEKGATIGANATLICGITVHAFAFIAAGAVVTKDVPAYALMMGNPAQQKGWMSEYGEKLVFNQDGFAVCPATHQTYRLSNNVVEKTTG
jgi:UDP-2-acetamido-3-amino-2,3-dideoxy-glucuronate N-acetyltransferase